MYFEISHKTTYTYSRPVFLEPHQLRVRPRCDGLQNLTDFGSKVQPRPAGSSDSMDLDGNVVSNIWFEGLTERFVIESRAKVCTQYRNPFLYILADRADRLPISYMEVIKPHVAPYITRLGDSDLVERFARQIANQTEWKTLRFLSALNREIYECCQQTRPEPGVLNVAEHTLLRKRGSCRDMAVLFIEACRYVGIAARYVSGYRINGADDELQYLAAWGEVYLPGAGWRGYDPSLGVAVTDRHVALAAAGIPILAAPVAGAFRGNAVTSELGAEIDIRAVAEGDGAAPIGLAS
jgi:transglutaminase-like putative cysteine protease